MSINPQFTYDNQGNPLGVFLSMEDWNSLAQKVDNSMIVSNWEQKIIKKGLQELTNNNELLIDWADLKAEMDREDGSL